MGEGDRGELVEVEATELAEREDETEEIVRLRAEIEASRMRIHHSLDHLREEFEETVDWRRWIRENPRRWVRENPWKTVGYAAALGFLWGSG